MMKKGYVITLDAIVASIVVLTIMVVASSFLMKSDTKWTDTSMLEIGHDVIGILERNKTIETMNKNQIQERIDEILPKQYNMTLKIDEYQYVGESLTHIRTLEVGGQAPENTVASGRRIAVKRGLTPDGDRYYRIAFTITQK